MARSYANIFTAIWRDDDFRALDGEAQRVYLLLATQPNISAAGMLPMTVGRWAAMSADTKPADIRAALSRLTEAHFVIADEVTEEVLVRSFVRHDKGYGNPKRVPVIRDAARDIESRSLRQALAVEFVRLDLPPEWTGELPVEPPPDGPPDNHPDRLSPDDATMSDHVVVDQSSSQVDSLSDSHGDSVSASERYRDTKATYVETLNPVPQTATQPPAHDELEIVDAEIVDPPPPALFVVPDPPSEVAIPEPVNAGQILRQWIDFSAANGVKLTTTVIKRYGRHIKSALDQHFSVELIKYALRQMLEDRVASRPALFDNYLIRAQQGPELPPARMSRHQAAAERLTPPGVDPDAHLRDILTRLA
ncbi:MAG TPA: hypothetical protein VGJ95_04975 [Pseudonocardiaceae bacterium]|jgi:hypothetical protein